MVASHAGRTRGSMSVADPPDRRAKHKTIGGTDIDGRTRGAACRPTRRKITQNAADSLVAALLFGVLAALAIEVLERIV